MRTDPFADKPVLRDARVLLRPFVAEDAETMAVILRDPEVLRLTGSVRDSRVAERPSTMSDERLRDWYATRNEHPDRLDLAIVEQGVGRLVGEVVLNELRAEDETCNLRILIGPQGRDHGVGSAALRLLVDHAFRTTELFRIELEVYDFNPRALHVYEQLGFIAEGRRRAALRFGDQRIDAISMSMLRPEWIDNSHRGTQPP